MRLERESGVLKASELAVFAAPRYLITVRRDGSFAFDQVIKIWDDNRDLAKSGVGFLLWGLLDHVVDGHFEVVQALDEEIDALEELLFDDRPSSREVRRRSFQLRKSLVELRRLVLPMREVLNALGRRELRMVDETIEPYYRDVYDHVIRASEWTESLRDLVSTVLETNLTIQGNRLNEIMKKLAGWAAVIAVPTAVTGFYGMNVTYPQDGTPAGFVTATLILFATTLGLYLLLKRRGWL